MGRHLEIAGASSWTPWRVLLLAPADPHACPGCGTPFVGFRAKLPCPACGRPADRSEDVVELCLKTYAANLRDYGSAIPPSIRLRTLRDDYVVRGLFLLRAIDEAPAGESEDEVIRRTLEVLEAPAGPGWRAHFEAFYRELARVRRQGPEREK